MKFKISGLLFACVVLSTASASAQVVDIANLYSTGVDNAYAPLALGTVDAHWETQINTSGWQSAIQEYTNFCGSCGNIWVNHPIGDDSVARPLAHPNYIQQAAPNQKFSWRTTFDIPADAALDTVTISYKVGYDDVSRNKLDAANLSGCNHTVWVNGTGYELTATGNNQRTECAATIPSGANFVVGQNTLEFRISNLATYYGFRWEKVSATYEVARQDLNLFSTGVDATGAPIAENATDTHWEVAINSLAWIAAVQAKTNFCGSCGSIWVNHPIGNDVVARPIAHPSYVRTTAANNKFSWRQSFDIPATADLSTVVIKYKVGFDDVSRNGTDTANLAGGCSHTVWINGTPHAITSTGDNQRTTCVSELPATASYVHGVNTIEFRIQNLATYYGFRFELDEATVEAPAAPVATIAITTPSDYQDTADTTPTIGGSATPGSTVVVEIRDLNGTLIETLMPTLAANGTWTIDAATLAENDYTIEATATLGTSTATAGPIYFQVDLTAPAVSITAPTDGTTLFQLPIALTGETDPTSQTVVLVVTDALGVEVMREEPPNGMFASSFDPAAAGAYTLEVTATDAVGNSSSDSVTFVYALGLIAIENPVFNAVADPIVNVAGRVINVTEVVVFLDDVNVGTAEVDGNDQWTYSLTDLVPGAHSLQGRNTAGDIESEITLFTVKMAALPAPVVISSPVEGAMITAGTVNVAGSGEPGTTVVVTLGDSMQTSTIDNNGFWVALFEDVAAGEYTITALGADGMSVTVSIIVSEPSNNNGTNNGTNNSTNNETNNSTNNGTNDGTGTMAGGTEDGCGCASTGGNASSALIFLLGLFGLRIRRRRR